MLNKWKGAYHTNSRVETRQSVTTIISILTQHTKSYLNNRKQTKSFCRKHCAGLDLVLVAPDKSLSWDPHSGWSSMSRNWWDSILHVLLAKKHMGCTTRQSCGIWEVLLPGALESLSSYAFFVCQQNLVRVPHTKTI